MTLLPNNDASNKAAIALATQRQREAAAPGENIFVTANAGSGKTRVLVSRVSRLLLSGVAPAKILCLTYTKAAAGEMQTRLFERLGAWSIMDDETLQAELSGLDGDSCARTADGLTKARRLFASALETPEGLKVQTIHAFCERLLRRFPVEAGIAPGFEALDDGDRQALTETVKTQIGLQAQSHPDADLARALAHLGVRYDNQKFETVLSRACDKARAIKGWELAGMQPLADTLGIDPNETADSVKRAAWADISKDTVRAAAHELAGSGVGNSQLAQIIYDTITSDDPIAAFNQYAAFFFTQSGSLKKAIASGRIAEDLYGSEKHGYGSETLRIAAAVDRMKAIDVFHDSAAVLTVSAAAAAAYSAQKKLRRKLDFNDQIHLARDLLQNSPARDWVRYKLDGGVDHVLIDEAQDTGPLQWDIIDAVCAEFLALEDSTRTKFAVGDEKQSIYGFQGAEPKLFIDRFREQTLVDAKARSISLDMSFRSAPQVLDFVDTVFNDCGAGEHIFSEPPAGNIAVHSAMRTDAGRVELWPLTKAPIKDAGETAWDATPPDALSSASSREALAGKIARYVKNMIDNGEQVYDREEKKLRPVQAGDIMVLVQKRTGFFDAIIRNLKTIGVAVAGADRLQLTSNIGVQDLMSLGKFVVLPADDLSLAEVLKSPMFGLSDDDLIYLTTNRGRKTLWEQLNTISIPAHLMEARGTLRKILAFAPGLAPYEFYARTLSTLMGSETGLSPDSILKRLYSRLGIEAADPIDAFLNKALAHQRAGPPALDKFLRDMDGDGSEVKREPDARTQEVRVMTVHGAKGLESPVVILPDTTQKSDLKAGFELDPVGGGAFAVRPPAKETPQALQALRDEAQAKESQEYLRRLYVALTRAESRLIICGFQNGKAGSKLKDGCWYDWASRAFKQLGDKARKHPLLDFDEPMQVFGQSQTGAAAVKDAQDSAQLPDWALTPAPAAGAGRRYVTPSHSLAGPAKTAPPMASPLETINPAAGPNPFARGVAIHKLLEILPDVAPARRADVARKYLGAHQTLEPKMAERIFEEVFSVLDNPAFADIFAPGSRAEVSLAGGASGLPKDVYLNAQIDRLAVSEKTVWIIDYKSNRPPPREPGDVAPVYIAQMAAYRALAQDIYPKKEVRCALLWTDAPRLMELPAGLLDAFDLRAAVT